MMVSALVVTIFFFFESRHEQKNQYQPPPEKKYEYQYARPSHRIKGFTYTVHGNGEKKISLQSKYLTINRSKIMGMGFSFMKEVTLFDGHIELYLSSPDKKILPFLLKITSENAAIFSRLKKISKILIRPITFEMIAHDQVLIKINARSAEFNPNERSIVFSDKVSVLSGQRKLIVNDLEFNLHDNKLTGTNYILKTPESNSSGHKIILDLQLRKLSPNANL